jgi:surface protein
MEQKRVSWFQGWFGIGLVLAITVPAVVLSWLTLNIGTPNTVPSAVNKLIAQECAGQELGACLQSQLGYVIFCNDSSLLFTCTLLPPPPVKRKRAAVCTSGPCWVLSGTLAAIGGPGMTIAPCPPSIPCTLTTNGMNVYCNAFSVSPAAPGEVYVCVNPSYVLVGSLVGGSGAVGPSGPQGAEGASGSIGTTGAIGGSGSQGQAGVAGATGATGTNGLAGGQGGAGAAGGLGTTGAPGSQGSTGAGGASGNTGAEGSPGSNGGAGATGASGFLGTAGTTGAIGITGAVGTTGHTGAAGGDGTVGAGGPDGSLGTNGGSGATGSSAAMGAQGSAGQSGGLGASGATGSNGAAGTAGSTGSIGSAGAAGGTGAPGAHGATGATGATGNLGGNGATGALGVSGAIGYEGASGATGSLGSSGQEGAAGGTGVIGPVDGGATGAGGAAGASGSVGSSGSSGALGEPGSAGVNGASGGLGSLGSSGSTGGPGPAGSAGSDGGNGGSGSTGVVGGSGAGGASGGSGITGSGGPTGALGNAGASSSGTSVQGGGGTVGGTGSSGPVGLTASSLLINYFTQPTAGSVSVNVANSIASTDYFVLFAHIRGGTTTLSSETPNAAAAPAFNPNRTTFTFPSITLAVNDTFAYRLYVQSNTVGAGPINSVKRQYTAQFCFLLIGYGTKMCWDTTTQNYCASVYPFQEGVTGTIFSTFGNVVAYINSTNAFVSPSGVNGGCWFEFPYVYSGGLRSEYLHTFQYRDFPVVTTLGVFPVAQQLHVTFSCGIPTGVPALTQSCSGFSGVPIAPATTFSGRMNYGDGGSDIDIAASVAYNFATTGHHTVKFAGFINYWSCFLAPTSSTGNAYRYITDITQWGNVLTGSMDFNKVTGVPANEQCRIQNITASDSPNAVTSAGNAFQYCPLVSMPNSAGWTFNAMTTPTNMFDSATTGTMTSIDLRNYRGPSAAALLGQTLAIDTISSFNLANWRLDITTALGTGIFSVSTTTPTSVDVSNWRWNGASTSFTDVFRGRTTITTLNVTTWDVDYIQNFANIFLDSTGLTTLDVSRWNTMSATTFASAFKSCTALTPLVVGNWDTRSVQSFASTFQSMTASGALPAPNTLNWNTTRVTTTASMFQSTNSMNPTVAFWNLPVLTTCAGMFQLSAGANPDLSRWNTPLLTTAANMFTGASNTGALQAGGWQAPALQTLTSMFQTCAFVSINLTGTSFPAATNMANMFQGSVSQLIGWPAGRSNPALITATSMFQSFSGPGTLDITNWSTPVLSAVTAMFALCTATTVNMTGTNFPAATSMVSMFESSTVEIIGGMPGWNTPLLTSTSRMFFGYATLGGRQAPSFTGWSTPALANMNEMFRQSGIGSISLVGLNVSQVTSVTNMFAFTSITVDMSGLAFTSLTSTAAMLFGGGVKVVSVTGCTFPVVTSIDFMFAGGNGNAGGLFSGAGWGTISFPAVTSAVQTFFGAGSTSGFEDLRSWGMGSATTLQGMFSDSRMGIVNVSGWSTGRVTNMNRFCGSVDRDPMTQFIGLETFDTSSVTDMSYMFWYFQGNLVPPGADPIYTGNWNVSRVTSFDFMFDHCGTQPGNVCAPRFLNWRPTSVVSVSNMFNLMRGMPPTSYDEFLIAFDTWSNNVTMTNKDPGNMVFGGIQYTAAGAAAHASLLNKGWTLSDAGQAAKRDEPAQGGLGPTAAPTTGAAWSLPPVTGPKADDFVLVRYGRWMYNYLFS